MKIDFLIKPKNIKADDLKGISWDQGLNCYLESPFIISASICVSASSFIADQLFLFLRPYGIKMAVANSS